MTITIADGRGALWQWDTGRRVKITDGDGVKQVHYQNKCFGRSVDVDVGADGTAIIPDELLQDCHTLTVYAYATDDAGGYTKVQQDFAVYKRAKPAGYVYTPTDQMTLQTIQRQIGDLADLTTEAKDTLVAAINEVASAGDAGSMALRVADGYVQYSTDGGSTWTNLIAMADLRGAQGEPGAPGKDGNPGAPGKDGAPGIYYGTTPPTGDTHPVWIDPDGVHDDGGLLPAVTASDNGKVLRVVSGAWEPVDAPSCGGGETWEKIAEIELRTDTEMYELADFGVWRKAKVIMNRSAYVSGLKKNVWVRVTRKNAGNYSCGYLTSEYGYVYWEFTAEVNELCITSAGFASNNINSSNNIKSTYTLTPLGASPSDCKFVLMFVDTSVIQDGDKVTVIGVRR